MVLKKFLDSNDNINVVNNVKINKNYPLFENLNERMQCVPKE